VNHPSPDCAHRPGPHIHGFVSYLFLLGSAVKHTDPPFRSPLAPFLTELWRTVLRFREWNYAGIRDFFLRMRSSWSDFVNSTRHVLSSFTPHAPMAADTETVDRYADQTFSLPFAEVPAVLWLLETSTDPIMIERAAGISLELQWPTYLDLTSAMDRLQDCFIECFETHVGWDDVGLTGRVLTKVRTGMSQRAILCSKAYCSLRLSARGGITNWTAADWSSPRYLVPCSSLESNIDTLADLATVVQLVTESPQWVLDVTIPNTLQWALYIIPSLRATTLEDLSNRSTTSLTSFRRSIYHASMTVTSLPTCVVSTHFCFRSTSGSRWRPTRGKS
jgi:hypothetical protein